MNDTPAFTIGLIDSESDLVRVHWADGHVSAFPIRWLRYECTCPECGESRTGIRFVTPADAHRDLVVERAEIDETGALTIRWRAPSHTSRYEADWLRRHCLDPASRAAFRHEPTTWEATLGQSPPSVGFDEFINDTARRCDGLEALRDYGLLHIIDGPSEAGTVERLATQIGPLEETNFGRIFDLKSTANAEAIGATRHPATLHTDECYRNMPTGIKLIHCLQDADPGTGYSLFADGFHLGACLQDTSPRAFELLSTVPLTFNRRYDDAIILASAPVFSLDRDGRLRGFRFQDRSMAPIQAPFHQVEEIMDAICELMALIGDPANQLRLRLNPGEAVLFDNHRVLHGRTGFTGNRHLQLCSVNRDTFISELRTLERDLDRMGYLVEIVGGAFA